MALDIPNGATPVVVIYQAKGDEGTCYTLRMPDGTETQISETDDAYGVLANIIDDAFGTEI
jgi:hypothetical protein